MGAALANLTNKLLRAPLFEALCGYTLLETNAEPLQRLGHSKTELKLNTSFLLVTFSSFSSSTFPELLG